VKIRSSAGKHGGEISDRIRNHVFTPSNSIEIIAAGYFNPHPQRLASVMGIIAVFKSLPPVAFPIATDSALQLHPHTRPNPFFLMPVN
jgi:hypothetical protein